MPVFLFAAGILLCVVGFFLIGFFIPNRDFSVGGTFILAGSVSIVGGLLLIGMSSAVRELRNLVNALNKGVPPARQPANAPARAAPSPAQRPPSPPPPTPVPVPRPGALVNTARNQRAEPRLDTPAPDASPPEPPMPSAPTIADVTAARPRGGLFASIRGRAAVEAAVDAKDPPMASPAPPRPADVEPPRFRLEPEPQADDQPPQHTSSLSALAARTAARLDLPRPVPDLPRTVPEPRFADSRRDEPLEDEPAAEKPERNMFDTVWPTETRSAPERRGGGEGKSSNAGADDIPPLELPPELPAEILKSGVIDGMAYTLYTDGSIEAQLPQGTLRFTSIDDLRAHLERH